MTEGLYIEPASMKALGINFKRFRKEVLASAHNGLVSFAMRIVASAKRNIEHNGSVASGLLRNSGRAVEQADGTVDAGFYANYAAYVEYGRKAGGMPPVDDIYQWIRRKRIQPSGEGQTEKLQRNLAWAIAVWIKNHGTKAHPFLKPAYEQYRWEINKFMQAQVDKAVARYKAKK